MRSQPRSFTILMIVLIIIGIVGLLACTGFFIMNQMSINKAFQNINNNPISPAIDPVEYIRELSEAQTAASTKDIISLLYGFLSSAFVAVGLNFLRESQQAAKETRDFAEKVKVIADEIDKKQKELTISYQHVIDLKKQSENDALQLKASQELQGNSILMQTYIEQALICSRSIELLSTISTVDEKTASDMVYRALPRMRDSMNWSAEIIISLANSNSLLGTKQVRILLRGIAEVKESIHAITKNSKENTIFGKEKDTWEEFSKYCDKIYEKLTEMRRRSITPVNTH